MTLNPNPTLEITMPALRTPCITRLAVVAASLLAATAAGAAITPIGLGDFSPTAALVDYDGAPLFDAVDGLTVGGVAHGFSVGGSASGDATINIVPGATDFITPFNIEGDSAGVLTLDFGGAQTRLGFGWLLLLASGGEVELFDAGGASLGSATFSGAPDSQFGWQTGYAAFESSSAFTRATVRFNDGGRFAFDDLRFEGGGTVPEPGTLAQLLAAAGVSACAAWRPARRRSAP
jgi:hypothetical protein